ncbi:hypothetical protein [Azospirillum halopraeferens]|uniref:hypothetical protein n=1 Tax=Azospirillum halopraeferens TaxID=34010 RepID=UPI0004208876|nr:hypothetical protein [Azospirillum halopraeferens]
MRLVVLAVVLTGLSGCAAVRTVDCWRLDGAALAFEKTRGNCLDPFAATVQEIVPPGFAARSSRPTRTEVRKRPFGADIRPARKPGTGPGTGVVVFRDLHSGFP